uniref:Ankyrin repeat domain-containing protein 55-like n=1 Tax=Saccoglossus kowalevskii TaxID=10224 RepID=A0ABM0MHR4_SACKO|nr:PREDICTED: ankyrin repeat domain-containing protein 55-like [Saccoglossus kowalevskii]
MEFPYSQVLREHLDDEEEEKSDNEDCFFNAHGSAGKGDIPTLMNAITQDPSVLEYQDTQGMTPLTHAVAGEQLETMKLLVKMGASINTQDVQGRTPLSVAAYQGWYAGVVFLLRNGAKQYIADKTGRLPLHAATYASDTRTPLHWAAATGQCACVEILLKLKVDPSPTDCVGGTPLDYAEQSGHRDVIKLLLTHGAKYGTMKPNIKENHQNNADSSSTTAKKGRFGFLSNLFTSKKEKVKTTDSEQLHINTESIDAVGKQVATWSPVEQRALKVLSPIPQAMSRTKNTNKQVDLVGDDLSRNLSLSEQKFKSTTFQKYSPLPSPVAMRRGHSDPTADNSGINLHLPGTSLLRPISKRSAELAAHVETSSQQILAAQRKDKGILNSIQTLTPNHTHATGSLSQGATPHNSPKLAPLRIVRPKISSSSYPPTEKYKPMMYNTSTSEDRSDDEEDRIRSDRPRSKSLQPASDGLVSKSSKKKDSSRELIDPLHIHEKSHRKKKKKNRDRRAVSLEEDKKGLYECGLDEGAAQEKSRMLLTN